MVYFTLCKRGDIERGGFTSHFVRGDIGKEWFASHFVKEVILERSGLLHTLYKR